jgi:hypothetical protein
MMIMNQSIRNLLISGVLLVFTLTVGAADTLKINITYKHKLNNAGQTTGFTTINQQFYTPDGILFREISYDDSTSQISGYVFYFYHNGLLNTQEFYNQQDSLQYILKHEYDQAGNEIMLTKLVSGLKVFTVAEKTVNVYDNSRKLLQQSKYFGKHKGMITRYQYGESGLLERELIKFKPIAKSSVKQETKDYSYSSDNRVSQVMITGKDASDKPFQFREEYTFNNKGLLSSLKQTGISNARSGEKVYKYLNSGTISLYEEHDAEGKLTLLLQYDYKKHYMDSGTQVSYYENL